MDDKIFDQIHEVDLKKTMETSYICEGRAETGAETCSLVHDRAQ